MGLCVQPFGGTESFLPCLLRSCPDHTGLFLGTEPQLRVKAWPPRAEPEKFHAFEAWMAQNPLHDLSSDPLLLIGLVHDDVPDRGAIDEIRQHAAEADQLITVPGAQCDVGVTQHFLCIFERAAFCPWRLMKQPQELRGFQFFLFGKCNDSLEGGGHLILE